MNQRKVFVLFVGATGKTGFHIANCLIDKQIPVRIIVRKKEKVTKLFQEKEVAFESIIECSDFTALDSQAAIKQAFEVSQKHGKITHVISALGANAGGKQNVEKIEYETQRVLIDYSIQNQIERYILLSGALITRAWHPMSIILNVLLSNVYAYKAKGQNYLRKSGLSYTIVRPGGLVGSYEDPKFTNYTLSQGDKGSGMITRATVAKLLVDSITTEGLKDKVTFECISTKAQSNEPYADPSEALRALAADTEQSIITANHSRTSQIIKFTAFSAIVFGLSRLIMNIQ